ncbi:calcium-dependent protein kinase 10-like [Stylonychia lemnae]|uniref:Calcium-dependent protein kinase 10-like n=1 Tax=Stylonychia lemnae TaxID=5949 RepID=A0A077ZN31_STYLE|nr:calcium-dependent protein kinase 10-like [Stylonychia lemnae]|eukprot:CDW71382.1 calcium-dependent protein kinase 10-like [Stylonychia lemnae]
MENSKKEQQQSEQQTYIHTQSPHSSSIIQLEPEIQKALIFDINHQEYGLPLTPTKFFPQLQYQPKDFGILDQFPIKEKLYSVQLSPTVIYLTSHEETDQQIIRKSIMKNKLLNDVQIQYARQECTIQSLLKHENIVELYHYTENDQEITLLMEYCNDANYFEDRIENSLEPIEDMEKLQQYGQDILHALNYLHTNGYIHSDMKIQNALLNRNEEEGDDIPIVKLCDFGLSHVIKPELNGKALMIEKCGTHGYIAPEIQAKNSLVGPEIDMWGFGVMLYEMCTAYKPTKLQNYRYGSGPIPFRDRDWRKVNKHIKDLIIQCLQTDPSKRISSQDALQHPWFGSE